MSKFFSGGQDSSCLLTNHFDVGDFIRPKFTVAVSPVTLLQRLTATKDAPLRITIIFTRIREGASPLVR